MPILNSLKMKGFTIMNEYFVINALNGAVQVVISKSKYRAVAKAKRIFGNVPLHIYAR
jgi:hypothetical protein